MSVIDYVKSSFTPYEMAVAQRLIGLLLLIAICLLGYFVARVSAFVLVIIVGSVLAGAAWYFSRCPQCGKPAGREYFFSERSFWGYLERHTPFGRWQKMWPDKECSECRYQLDLFPEQQFLSYVSDDS